MHRMMWGKVYYVEVSLVSCRGDRAEGDLCKRTENDSRANLTSYFRGGASTERR